MLDEIAAWLETQCIGVVGQDIFRHRLPDSPDTAILLTPYAGSIGPRVHDATRSAYRVERFQLLSRSGTRAAANARAEAAYAVLWLNNMPLGAGIVVKSEPLQPPFYMPEDERNRAQVVFNIEVWSD